MTITWLAETLHEGCAIFRIGREGDRLVADWPGMATFAIQRDGTGAAFEAVAGADPALVAKLQSSAVPALVRHLQGRVSLHASAVASSRGAIAFVGDSGAGKSTLAYALASDPRTDLALASDDCLVVDDAHVVPSDSVGLIDGPARRALGLSAGDAKAAARPQRIAREAVPLRRIVALSFGDGVRLAPLKGSAIAAVLGRAMIRFVLDEPAVHAADLQRLSELASRVEVFELARPRGFDHLDETLALIERLE